ncbi:metallophosphoesterase family protein [Rhizobium sp. C1]|uniref:metallophosphoesterase family protein n=1 Tax=Rhizobium sp. C1 TaxID=1349799 RepID=UPI001E58D515|nr:metallophosphoesterase [Rhizobium sp. C1]MCD2178186.1 metallophosphoesterase [Rhizobium sp. C1]
MKIAVVADIHLHDLHGGYGLIDKDGEALALRTFEDTIASTRVFNESCPAVIATLDDIARRGIRDVVFLGDYSDDGQPGAVDALKQVLSFYESRHCLRFFTTLGNHDAYGPAPRHHVKALTTGVGGEQFLVASDPAAPEADVVSQDMRGMSTAEAMQQMARFGFARPEGVFHWETPFGSRETLVERFPPGGDPLALDASYLVEPQEGLWLLVLDANVFSLKDGVWKVEDDAAWDHVLARRPYFLPWLTDVAARAARLGKVLLAFSHYPVLPLTITGEGADCRAAGTPDRLARMPSLDTGRRLAGVGLTWHFSGHMHVAGRVELDGLTNVAVPSPVAYPGGYVVVEIDGSAVDVQTIALADAPGFDLAFSAYEAQIEGRDQLHPILATTSYADFLEAHLRQLVATRHVPEDWPELVPHLDEPIGAFWQKDGRFGPMLAAWQNRPSLPLRAVLEDYYLRRARGGPVWDIQ